MNASPQRHLFKKSSQYCESSFIELRTLPCTEERQTAKSRRQVGRQTDNSLTENQTNTR